MLTKRFGPRSPLESQLPLAKFDIRHMTGKGYFIEFSLPKSVSIGTDLNTELSEDYRTKRLFPVDFVGFTLFVRKGRLSSFEGYTYGDAVWPEEPLDEWLILDPVEAPHQKAK
jgi:hypothetical protein